MRRAISSIALALVVAASTAHAAEPDESPTVASRSVTVRDCNTDGGPVKCSVGTQTLAKGLGHFIDYDLGLRCPGAKRKTHTIKLSYEYNDGVLYYYSHSLAAIRDGKTSSQAVPNDEELFTEGGKPLRKKPGLPRCLNEALPRIGEKLLAFWEVLRQIDPEVDVRSTYVLKLQVK